jgi:phage-related holin
MKLETAFHWTERLIVAAILVMAPAKSMIITTLVLILIDLVTGVLASRKMKRPITSSGLKKTIVKLAIYEVAIIAAFLTQTYLTGTEVPVSSIVTGYIGLTELTSVIENLNIISGNKLLKTLIEKLGTIKK